MSAASTLARLAPGEHVWDLWRPPAVSARGAFRMWQRNVRLYRRDWKLNVLPNFFEPVLYLLAIGLGLGLYVRDQIREAALRAAVRRDHHDAAGTRGRGPSARSPGGRPGR